MQSRTKKVLVYRNFAGGKTVKEETHDKGDVMYIGGGLLALILIIIILILLF